MIFPYQRYAIAATPAAPDGVLYRPEVPIRIRGQFGELSLFALLDTGADETILPRSIAKEVGIPIDQEHTSTAVGFSGHPVHIAYGHAHFELEQDGVVYRWSSTIGFCDFDRPEDEAVILGHAGCLEFLQTAFDGEKHQVELQPTRASMGIRMWL